MDFAPSFLRDREGSLLWRSSEWILKSVFFFKSGDYRKKTGNKLVKTLVSFFLLTKEYNVLVKVAKNINKQISKVAYWYITGNYIL